jgi:hypothetical protein
MSIAASSTITLSSNLTLVGSLTSAAGTNVMNGNTCYIGNDLTVTSGLSGTTNLIMVGSGKIETGTITISNNLAINTSGSITLATLRYQTGTFSYVAGTIVPSGSAIFDVNNSCTVNAAGMTFPYFRVLNGAVTMAADLNITALYLQSIYLQFYGNFDCTVGDIYQSAALGFAASSFGFPAGRTLSVLNTMNFYNTSFSSGTASSETHLKFLGAPSGMKTYKTTFTDVDASGSAQEIKNYNGGTLTRCTNIRNVNLPVIPSSVSIGG